MRRALRCWRHCRSEHMPQLDCRCDACLAQTQLPQACPHCQHDVCADWLEQQRRLRLPVDYFLLTLTLAVQLRGHARRHPREVYVALMRSAWATLARPIARSRMLFVGWRQAQRGPTPCASTERRRCAVAVQRSGEREARCWGAPLAYPNLQKRAALLNLDGGQWKAKRRYLFNSQNLAREFRAKLLQRLRELGLSPPAETPKDWVAHCACVGDGEHALAYLARYLYRGVLSEADMLGIEGENVRFRYRDAKTGELRTRMLSGADFLWLLLPHALPRGFRRCRSYGLLHRRGNVPLQRVQLMLRVVLPPAEPRTQRPLLCRHYGQPMRIRPAAPPRPYIESVQTPTPAEGHGTV